MNAESGIPKPSGELTTHVVETARPDRATASPETGPARPPTATASPDRAAAARTPAPTAATGRDRDPARDLGATRTVEPGRLDRFLQARTVGEALRQWFGGPLAMPHDRVAARLNADIARIDRQLTDQINAILHAPAFQRLEAAWRGLQYLVGRADLEGDPGLKIKVLNVTWKELRNDFERSVEFDQSQLFKKVYEQDFGTAGGEPYGALIADYEVHPHPTAEHPYDDISMLESLAQVSAAAFAPLIINASPAMFGLDGFQGLEHTIDHSKTFAQTPYLKWRSLRSREDARFVALTLPRILMRLPYQDDGTRVDRFIFHEDVSGPDQRKYLWGGAAFAMGEVLLRSFAQSGWLADIRGVRREEEGGGLVTGLPVHSFGTDRRGVAVKCSTDVVVTEELEKQLSELGFMPLCHCWDTNYSAFFSSQSLQKPAKYDRDVATTNAKISAMLQYMLCVSRFAHYVKVLGREKIGSFIEAHQYEDYLQRWIIRYVTADAEAKPETRARLPLRDAQIRVRPVPGKPGSYSCIMHLAPHYELDELTASVKLVAELTPVVP